VERLCALRLDLLKMRIVGIQNQLFAVGGSAGGNLGTGNLGTGRLRDNYHYRMVNLTSATGSFR
jgi:hypothetical protein